MGVPFSRSVRSLRADGFRYTLAALGVALLLLGVWLVWFFTATIAFYVYSTQATLVDGEFVYARFDTDDLARIARGQPALFYPDDEPADPEDTAAAPTSSASAPDPADETAGLDAGIAVVVTAVDRSEETPGRVSLVVRRERGGIVPALPVTARLSGRVAIEVGRRTPAQMLLGTVGAGAR